MKTRSRLFGFTIVLLTTLTLLNLVAVPIVRVQGGKVTHHYATADVSAEGLSLCHPPDPCVNVRLDASLSGPSNDALTGSLTVKFQPPGPPNFEPPDPCFASVTGVMPPGPPTMPTPTSVTITGIFHGPGQSGKACIANLQGLTFTLTANSADGTITLTTPGPTPDSGPITLASGIGTVNISPIPPSPPT